MECTWCSARNVRCLLFVLLLGLGAAVVGNGCGSGDKVSVPKACTSDADCESTQGCLAVSSSESYCAPLCQRDSTCPAKMACPLYDLVVSDEAPSCVQIGAHRGVSGVCGLYERGLGPSSCPRADSSSGTGGYAYGFGGYGYGGYRGYGGYGYGGYGYGGYGYGGRGGSGGSFTVNTNLSCRLSNCSGSGFNYSCATSSSKAATDYNYDSSGNLIGWSTTVTYDNGTSVKCEATGAHGSCTGTGGAECTW
jgi:hypothetical protein